MTEEQRRQRADMITRLVNDEHYVPMKVKEMAILLGVSREQRGELQEVLDLLVEEGKISLSKRGKYSKAEPKLVKGVYTGNTLSLIHI